MPQGSLVKLTDKDYQTINRNLANLEVIRQEIERAASAGIPCEEGDQACQALRDQLSKIKSVYFPGKP